MKLRLAISAIGLVMALTGCATDYQSKGLTGGFSETMLSPDTFKIDFAGNGYTSGERASDFAILRAADKSLELGCNYFGVMREADSASVGSITVGSGGWNRYGYWGSSSTMPVVKPNSSLLVKCSRDKPVGANLFDAHFIAQSIRTKYNIKPAVTYVAPPQVPTTAPAVSPASTEMAALAAPGVGATEPDQQYAENARLFLEGSGCPLENGPVRFKKVANTIYYEARCKNGRLFHVLCTYGDCRYRTSSD